MTVRAKMMCHGVEPQGENMRMVTLGAVHSNDPADPNHSYSQATPWAELRMSITNPAAYGYFKPGQTYVLDFREEAAPA